MADSLYILSTEPRSGKRILALGIMDMLLAKIGNVGFFRPVANEGPGLHKCDPAIELVAATFGLEFRCETMFGLRMDEFGRLFRRRQVRSDPGEDH